MHLAELNPKDNQQVFDFVKTHLLNQGCRAQKQYGSICQYRFGDLKCAAGCLIPDTDYRKDFEEGVIGDTDDENSRRITDYFQRKGYDITLIRQLQRVHDYIPVSDWPKTLSDLALDFGLRP